MQARLVPRTEISQTMVWLTPVLAILLTLFFGAFLFIYLGFDPVRGLQTYFIEPVSTAYGVGELALKATPLALIALGLSLGFRANVWNIGAEGQFTVGAICGGGVALLFYDTNSWWLLPLMALAGIIGGMAYAFIPALLKTRFNANEILTSLMLTYLATLFLSYLVHGPWRDPDGLNFPESRMFSDSAALPILMEGTRFNVGAIVAIGVIAAVWLLLARGFIGYQIKVVGQAPKAAAFAGFDPRRVVWLTFGIGGGLAGLSGLFEVSGAIGQLHPSISSGYGFTAIIVAFLGRLHPIGIIAASLLIALSYLGGETAQISMGLPLAITGVFQGMLLFFLLGCDVLIRYRLRFSLAAMVR
jgi:ABC-type uncharacterized transport system permease subunit